MYLIITTMLLFFTDYGLAASNCNISDINSFYGHIKRNSPIISEVKKKKEKNDSELELAEQRPNPELSLEYLKGDEFGLDINTLSLTAEHTFEYGSKRSKRIEKANAFRKLNNSQADLALYGQLSNYALVYQKVGQLSILIKSVKEAISTFDKIVSKLNSRVRLTPEETISLSTIILASNEYKSQLSDFENEKDILLGKLRFVANCSDFKVKHTDLKYPEVETFKEKVEAFGLPEIEDFKVNLAQSELEVEKSLGYSNIQIGPALEYESRGSDEFLSAGIAVSFAFPMFHTNNGGKVQALKKLQAQKAESSNNKKMLTIEKSNLYKKYSRSLRTYKNMPSLKELERKHVEVERLYSRGIVSITMTIESHRQQIEFLKSRFETENDLLTTYVRISLIEGSIEKFKKLLN